MNTESIRIVATEPISGQKPGTSGLRKKTRVFQQPQYVENFVQSIFNALRADGSVDFSQEALAIGGDGRFFNREAIQKIIKIAAANGFGRILVGTGGLLSTPAMSALIRRRKVFGGILLTASHNPGGPNEDFGIKYNIRNGGPAPEAVTDRIYAETMKIERFLTYESPDIELDSEGDSIIGKTRISIIDPLIDYIETMKELFDFEEIRKFFQTGFRLVFDAMHGVTGIYANRIFIQMLGAPENTVIRGIPLTDFGGLHPDPNQLHAAELVRTMSGPDAPDMGAACDGDGDRNMILGRNFFVTPGDSLAIIAENARECLPGYKAGLAGVARSMPTSAAVDRVAQSLGIACYETPTGWKFFGNLMDAGMCTMCGEESFGTGSSHIREKDGLWAVLAWLAIIAKKRRSVEQLSTDHWRKFGRSYFQRHDYEGLDAAVAAEMLDGLRSRISSLVGAEMAFSKVIKADDFCYHDPVDCSVSARQGLRFILEDGSRIIGRLSGTGTEGATLRLYFERYRQNGDEPIEPTLQPLIDEAFTLFSIKEKLNREHPTVIT